MPRSLPEDWILPALDDRTRPFFTTGRLLLQACKSCGAVQHPPEDVCRRCQAMEFETRESAGLGTVYSFTVIHHPVHPILDKAVPYAVALVQLDDFPHVRLVGNVLNVAAPEVRIGLRVKASWQATRDPATGEELLLPQWLAVKGAE